MSDLFHLDMDFNRFKDIVTNVIWLLGLIGIGLEVSPIKINPLKAIIRWIISPFRSMVKEELAPVKDELQQHKEEIEKINNHLNEKEEKERKEELSEKRWKILNFGDSLRCGNEAAHEMYEYISNLHDQYVQEIEKQGLQNGVMDVTWEYIENKYRQHLQNNDFIG